MMNNPSKNPYKIEQGTIICGKWHKHTYVIIHELGSGANGTVYLAGTAGGRTALKISHDPLTITSEVNVLKSFAKVQGSALGPSLLDVDDWETPEGRISFYAMEYISGPGFLEFLEQKGIDWLDVLLLQLLKDLQVLHKNGWIFGDLKPENLIVTGPPARIRCIDTGGTTPKGRAIKEFTEFFDRGYWGLGGRKADEQYDLFAVAMIIINAAYPKRFSRKEGGKAQLLGAVNSCSILTKYSNVIECALSGSYRSAEEMRKGVLGVIQPSRQSGHHHTKNQSTSSSKKRHQQKGSAGTGTAAFPGNSARRGSPLKHTAATQPIKATRTTRSAQHTSDKKKKSGLLETAVILAIVSILYFFYLYSQLV
ncbi:protein kinase domain-containing protein [Bacillus massilinigeriensis]|uniref:protein kinase domain-containing protein n=1 Tax=Bacillus mediterraneensis TaxID=1805474 RepID=UPI0008F8BC67|nr:serine/threonine-protein kinase [Bacillus mediterraneensis]